VAAPINEADGFAAEGDAAVELLTSILAVHRMRPTTFLAALFHQAGRTPLVKDLRWISTERILYATRPIAERMPATTVASSAEGRVIREVARLLQRDPEKFDLLFADPVESPDSIERGESAEVPIRLSDHVEEALRQAVEASMSITSPSFHGEVSVLHFLGAFPPSGSKGAHLLEGLGVGAEEFRAAIAQALRDPRISPSANGGSAEKGSIGPAGKIGDDSDAPPPPAPAPNDRVSTHADEPATLDELGRAAFADILADRIREARRSGQTAEPSAFIVHLHGPWGSGKSSVLNFLEENLSQGQSPWIVVKFNAWRDQRLQPPWWRLITTIYYGARAKLGWRAPWLWLRWLIWRVRADYMPLLSVLIVASVATFLLWRFGWPMDANDGRPPGWMDIAKWLAPLIITLVTAIYVNSRSLALGSRRAAQTYADLKDDPFKPITKLFNRLVASIDRPLVVFIDDLDRCDSKYVVELLEGIQTLMRGAAVTYVVAADRKWICSSFEQRYAGFSPPIGESGRPLGYLFLDKLFQVSAAIPQIPRDVQSSYWARLLSPEPPDPRQEAEARVEAAREAEQEASGLSRQEDLQALVQDATETGDRIRIQAVRAACAKRISSPEAVVDTEHRLQAFAHLLEPNPRAMKRLVNAYAMHQATLLLAGRETGAGPLARWTILELRWPLLADFLAVRCECVDALRRRLSEQELPQIPVPLRCLFGDDLVQEVVGAEGDEDRLTTQVVKTILGSVQGDR
jgi:KAP family P-loop domain